MDASSALSFSKSFKLQSSRRLIPAQGAITVRSRVKNAIERGLSHSRLLFAYAPKGFGKTLAVGAYARSIVANGGQAEWVQLEEREESVEAFLCYLLDAFKSLLDISEPSISDIQNEAQYGWREALELFLLALNRHSLVDSNTLSEPQKLLVINGWGQVSESDDHRYILETLIRFTPANIKLMILSSCLDESLINSPVMLNIQPQLMHYFDFSMGYSDVADRLHQLRVLEADDRAHLIMQKTLGWPLAVEIMVKDACTMEAGDNSEERLLARLNTFLAEQFNYPELQQSAHVLAVLSLVERVSESFCVDVFGEQGQTCYSMLKKLLILQATPENGNNGYYLLNPIVRHWLVETHLKAMSEDLLSPWIIKASEWFVNHQAFSEAINLCTYLGDVDVIKTVAEHSCDFLLQQHGFHQLKRLDQVLDTQIIDQSPKLKASLAWAWAYSMDFDQADVYLKSIQDDEAESAEVLPLVILIRGWCARYRGDYALANKYLEQYRQLDTRGELTEAMFLMLSARIALAQGQMVKAEERISESLRKARKWSDARLESAVLLDLCRYHRQRGDWHASLTSIDRGLSLLRKQTLGTQSPIYGRMMMLKSYILWIQGDWVNAEDTCDQGVKAALHNEDPMLILGFTVKAMLYRGKRSYRKAHRGIFEVERLMHCWGVPDDFYKPLVLLVKAYLKLDEGQIMITQSMYSELMELRDWHPALLEWFPYLDCHLELLGIRLQCCSEEWSDALFACNALTKCLSGEALSVMQIPIMVLQATCHDALGESKLATKVIKRALHDAMSCNFIAPFMELGGQVAPLLARLNERGELGEFIYQLQHLEGLREHLSIGNDVCVPLSDREQGVLNLIAEGYSNQGVADKLFISLNTVKTHARKINTKLGVKNRTQAIAKARELGLL